MSGKHTPEPWNDGDDAENVMGNPVSVRLFDAKGFPIVEAEFTCVHPGYEAMGFRHWSRGPGKAYIERPEDEVYANIRRVRACVNALAGVSTEDLEKGAVKALVEALEPFAKVGAEMESTMPRKHWAGMRLYGRDSNVPGDEPPKITPHDVERAHLALLPFKDMP